MGPAMSSYAALTPGADPISWMYMAMGAAAGSVFAVAENRLRASGLGFVDFVAANVGAKHTGKGEKGDDEERRSLV